MQPAASDPTLAPPRALRLHLGAHKTATTHLQDTLLAARASLRGQGVDVLPLLPLRAAVAPLNNRRRARWWLRGAALQRAWLDVLTPLRSGPDTLVLSEENFLGGCEGPLLRRPYGDAARRLRPLGALAQMAPTTVFFAIRSFDELLPSAYAQTLRHRAWPESFDAIRARAMARPPSWLPVLLAIRRALPGAALRIWRYEDYRPHGGAIRAALCGVAPGRAPDLPPPTRTRTPGARAIEAAAALPPSVRKQTREDTVNALYAASCAAEDPRWTPFDPMQTCMLKERYDADLERIERLFPGALMQFDDAPADQADAALRTSCA